jgi:hypothetical protein
MSRKRNQILTILKYLGCSGKSMIREKERDFLGICLMGRPTRVHTHRALWHWQYSSLDPFFSSSLGAHPFQFDPLLFFFLLPKHLFLYTCVYMYIKTDDALYTYVTFLLPTNEYKIKHERNLNIFHGCCFIYTINCTVNSCI